MQKHHLSVPGGLKLVVVERVVLLCSTWAPTGGCCWRWNVGWALGHPLAKPAKQGPGVPFAGESRVRASANCGGRTPLTTRLSISEPHCPCRQAWSLLDTL